MNKKRELMKSDDKQPKDERKICEKENGGESGRKNKKENEHFATKAKSEANERRRMDETVEEKQRIGQQQKRQAQQKKALAELEAKVIMKNVRGQMIPISVPKNHRTRVSNKRKSVPGDVWKRSRYEERYGRAPRKRRRFWENDEEGDEFRK